MNNENELNEAYAELKLRLEEREILHDLLVDALDFVQMATGLCMAVPDDYRHCKEWQDTYREVCKKYKIKRKKSAHEFR